MQNFIKSSHSKKQSSNQTLTRLRQLRLRKNFSLLGEPDIITVTKIKTTSSFFSKQKKNQQCTEYFINGIIFPTTAHFSTYISSKYQNNQGKSSGSLSIKAKLIMFDAFQQKDVHAQINIPGSLQIKVFNLSGQALKSQPEDYQRAYFSSYLRSLKPMNYPNIVLNPYIYKIEVHKEVLKKFVPFCFENSLRQLKYEIRSIYTPELQTQYNGNLALQIVLNFITKYKFWSLIDFVLKQLEKAGQQFELKDLEYLNYRIKFLKKQYEQILSRSSQLLIQNSSLSRWKELQLESLYKLKNFRAAKTLGQNLIRKGGTHSKIHQLMCMSYLQTKDFKNFLKVLNSILTLYNEEQTYVDQVSYKTKKLYFMDIVFNKGENISSYPELCFEFDNNFLNKQNKLTLYKQSMIQNQNQNSISYSKNDPLVEMFEIIQKIDHSLDFNNIQKQDENTELNFNINNIKTFYSLLVKFEKLKGWADVIKLRAECFWLENDFKQQEQSMQSTQSILINSSSLNLSQKKIAQRFTNSIQNSTKLGSTKNISEPFGHIQMNQLQKSEVHQIEFENNEQKFDEDFNNSHNPADIQNIPACSKRVSHNANTARRNFVQLKKTNSQDSIKVICSMNLQKIFLSLYQDLKLQIQLQKWAAKLNLSKISQISPQKRELMAIIFLKKAFLHLKLQRYRKCEQSLKFARKISQSILILLVSSYQLINLYIKNKIQSSMKGVELYTVDLIKIFSLYGINRFDIVPEWAKQVIAYVIENQGIKIIGNLAGPFKQLIVRWMRNNYSQSAMLKKDGAKNSQMVYNMSS